MEPNLTYRELLAIINQFTPEQLDMHVSIYAAEDCEEGEFYELECVRYADEYYNDVLDKDHPYLVV